MLMFERTTVAQKICLRTMCILSCVF